MFWEHSILDISKKKKKKKEKLESLGKNLGIFLETYIWMSSSVVKLQAILQLYQ